jgi:tetratricopeptide (TPR) repeat protein
MHLRGLRSSLSAAFLIVLVAAAASAAFGLTALQNAIHKGDIKKVQELLDKGADINEWKYGTPLMMAASEGRIEIATLLVARGADINVQSKNGWCALGFAAEQGQQDMVNLLVAKGADIDLALSGMATWAAWANQMGNAAEAQKIAQAAATLRGSAGLAYYNAGNYEKALAVFQSRAQAAPNDAKAWIGVAFSSVALKKYDDARAAAETAVKLNPDDIDANLALGDALLEKGDAAAAVTPLKKAVELNPKNPWGFNRLGRAYFKLENAPEAVANFRKAAELAPQEPAPIGNVMNTCARMGDFDGAIAASDRLLVLLPPKESGLTLGYRSVIYREKAMPAQAAAEAARAASIDPDHDWVRTASAAVALDKGDFDEAIRQISGVKDREFALARLIEATAFAKKGDVGQAEQIYAAVGGDAVSSPNVIVARNARLLADLLKPAAQAHLEKAKALEAGPSYREAVAEYALALKTADNAGAREIRTRVAAIVKTHPEVGELPEDSRKYVLRAEVLVDEKKPGEALEQFASARALAPFFAQTYYNMAVLSASTGRFKEAVGLMRAYLDLAPDAKNAREATDLIYKWEFQIERASGKQ